MTQRDLFRLESDPDYWWLCFRYATRDGRVADAEEALRQLKALGVEVHLRGTGEGPDKKGGSRKGGGAMTTFLKPADIAQALGVKLQKLHAWLRSGELVGVNVATRPHGRPRWRISQTDWQAFCLRRASRPPVKPVRRRRQPANVIQFV